MSLRPTMASEWFSSPCDKSNPALNVECDAVRVLDPWKRQTLGDPVRPRIDHRKQIHAVHRHQNLPGHRIVHRISRATAQSNLCDQLVALRIDHRIHTAVLIRDEDFVLLRRVSESIGIDDGTGLTHNLQRLRIHRHDLMRPGPRRIHTMDRARHSHAVNPWKPVKICYDLPVGCIEDHQLICIHVRDVQPSARWIKALVVETDRWPRHWNIDDFDQHLFYLPGRLGVRQHKRQENERRHVQSRPRMP